MVFFVILNEVKDLNPWYILDSSVDLLPQNGNMMLLPTKPG